MNVTALEDRLREFATDVDWPPTPELAAGVLARIEASAPAPRRSLIALGRRQLRAVVAAIVAGLVAGALVEPVRSAVLDVLGIAGRDRVIRVPGPPDTSRPALDRGAPTTLELARGACPSRSGWHAGSAPRRRCASATRSPAAR